MTNMDILQAGLQGLARAEKQLDQSAERIARFPLASPSTSPEDSVDLSAEFVSLILAKNAYLANLKSIETGADLAKSTINLLG